MPFVRSFNGYRPPARNDGIKWTSLRILESASADGPFEHPAQTIDTQAIADYPNSANPPTMNFTTDDAVLESGWYVVEFLDPNGGVARTTPEASSGAGILLPPSPSEVRSRSHLLRLLLPPDPVDADVEETLRQAVYDAVALVEQLTCRSLQAPLGREGVKDLDRLAMRAVVLKTEKMVMQEGTAVSRKKILGNQLLKSISAGPWSETYFGPEEASKAKVLDTDPALHEVLWALATEECRDQWLFLWGMAAQPPFGAVKAFDWQGRGHSISASRWPSRTY